MRCLDTLNYYNENVRIRRFMSILPVNRFIFQIFEVNWGVLLRN